MGAGVLVLMVQKRAVVIRWGVDLLNVCFSKVRDSERSGGSLLSRDKKCFGTLFVRALYYVKRQPLTFLCSATHIFLSSYPVNTLDFGIFSALC